jgi:hypothetical protein
MERVLPEIGPEAVIAIVRRYVPGQVELDGSGIAPIVSLLNNPHTRALADPDVLRQIGQPVSIVKLTAAARVILRQGPAARADLEETLRLPGADSDDPGTQSAMLYTREAIEDVAVLMGAAERVLARMGGGRRHQWTPWHSVAGDLIQRVGAVLQNADVKPPPSARNVANPLTKIVRDLLHLIGFKQATAEAIAHQAQSVWSRRLRSLANLSAQANAWESREGDGPGPEG